jgi:hypothetical protein
MTHLSETIKPIQFIQALMADETWKAITKEYLQKNKKERYIDQLLSNYEHLCSIPQ